MLTLPLWVMQVGEEDYNFDGKPDMIRFTARIASAMPVHSVKLLLQFNYTLKVCCVWDVALLQARPSARAQVCR